jgi:hypothetical protein
MIYVDQNLKNDITWDPERIGFKDLPENQGRFNIVTNSKENKYFYIFRLDEKSFMELWEYGMTVKILPQKYFDSSGEGKKILNDKEE